MLLSHSNFNVVRPAENIDAFVGRAAVYTPAGSFSLPAQQALWMENRSCLSVLNQKINLETVPFEECRQSLTCYEVSGNIIIFNIEQLNQCS